MDYKITELEKDQRFDRFLRKILKENEQISLWRIYKFIRKWQIRVNWKKEKDNYRLKVWDMVNIPDNIFDWMSKSKEEKIAEISLDEIKSMIIFEDDNFIFFNKPAWVAMHEWNKHMKNITMNSFLDKYVEETKIQKSSTFSPAFCFRLDKNTSWVLIAGKNYQSLKALNEMIRERKTNKTYLAVISWKWRECKIKKNLEKIYDKEFWKSKVIISSSWDMAETHVKVLKRKYDKNIGDMSLLKIKLLTWRMHQIRVHLSSEKMPIIWDLMYWNPVINRISNKFSFIKRQLLHSWEYSFEYGWKKYLAQAEIPEDFKRLFEEM